MIKNAAVTGHTSGLGAMFFKLLNDRGYQVQGFSRSNGYDLRDYSVVGRMLEETQNFDLFINNAKPDYAQAQILYRLCRLWTKGTIISVGSNAVNQNPGWTDTFLLEYLTQKTALTHAHSVLEPIALCNLIIVHPQHLGNNTEPYVKKLIEDLKL